MKASTIVIVSRFRDPRGMGIALASLAVIALCAAVAPGVTSRHQALADADINRAITATTPPVAGIHFSKDPADDEFLRTGLFVQPLVPAGPTSRSENRGLADALLAYHAGTQGGLQDSVEPLTTFISTHPTTAWKPALLLDLGEIYRRTGHFSLALQTWQSAWDITRDLTDPNGRAIGDMAVAYLSQFQAYLGRTDALKELLDSVKTRPIRGAAAELVSESSRGLADMVSRPEVAFKCGPSALARILEIHPTASPGASRVVLERAESTPNGLSLTAVQAISAQAGMNYQMAFRSPGAAFLVPAVVNWKAGHYAALLGQDVTGRYLVGDPTFGEDIHVTLPTLEQETTGYYLVPAGALPTGWRYVDAAEGDTVWGRGDTGSNHDNGATGPQELHAFGCGPGGGCSGWNVEAMVAGLSLHDDPIGYTPPLGPPISFPVDYSHRDMQQPMTFAYTNFGNKWTTEWLSYVSDNTGCDGFYGGWKVTTVIPGGTVVTQNLNPDCVVLYRRGGGNEPYLIPANEPLHPVPNGDQGQDSTLGVFSQSVMTKLVSLTDPNTPVGFWRTLPDGSIEKFELPFGAGQFFLTEVDDPQGNAVKLTYDNLARIVAITDALDQITTVCYSDSWQNTSLCAQPPAASTPPTTLQVTQVRDPFGRSAYFGYDPQPLAFGGTGHLTSITDVLGIASTFEYQPGSDFISTLTTPYGTTHFTFTDSTNDNTAGSSRTVTIVDPLNRTSRVEFRQGDFVCGPVAGTGDVATIDPHFLPCSERATPTGLTTFNGFLEFRNTFSWDPQQYQTAFGNGAPPSGVYTSANVIHWLHTNDSNVLTAARIPESFKTPLDHRVWINYENQIDNEFNKFTEPSIGVGSTNQPVAIGRLLDDGHTQLWTAAYNAYGHVTQVTDPVGRQLTLTYEPNGLDLSTVRNTSSDGHGGRLSDLLVTFASYNGQHEPQTVTGTDSEVTTYSYNASGQLTAVTDPLGETWRSFYIPSDGGYLDAIEGPGPQVPVFTFVYDSFGRLFQSTDTIGGTRVYSYDAANRITNIQFPDLSSEAFAYTLLDLTSVTDRRNFTTTRHFDSDRELYEIDEPLGRTTLLGYTPNRFVATMQDPNGSTTTWTRDIEGRALSLKYADGSSVSYTYDGDNRVSTIKTLGANVHLPGVSVDLFYNPDDTLAEVETVGAQRGERDQVDVLPTFFSYDPAYRRLTGWTQGQTRLPPHASSESFVYGNICPLCTGSNRLVQDKFTAQDITGTNNGITVFTDYFYDALGRVNLKEIGPGTANLVLSDSWEYDSLGRVSTESNDLDDFTYFYSDATPRVAFRGSSGLDLVQGYDSVFGDELLQEMVYTTPQGFPVAQYHYGYDTNHNVTEFDDATGGGVATANAYTYDAYNQLVSAAATAGPLGVSNNNYGYDGNGNMASTSVSFFGVPFSQTQTAYSLANRITSTTTQPPLGPATTSKADYDVSGNLTSLEGTTYLYDRLNRLVEVHHGNRRSVFAYDGLGRLVQVVERAGGKTVANHSYGWCQDDRCLQYDNLAHLVGESPFLSKYYLGQGELVFAGVLEKFYYVTDAFGTVRLLTRPSQGDPTEAQYAYDPYGSQVKVRGNGADADFGFGHYFYDRGTGLSFTNNRVYNAALGRWLTQDPIGNGLALASGPGFNATDANLYPYADNNPTSITDPTGNCPWCFLIAEGGGFVNAGIYAYNAPTSLSWGEFLEGAGLAFGQGFLDSGLLSTAASIPFEAYVLGVGATQVGGEDDLWKMGCAMTGGPKPAPTVSLWDENLPQTGALKNYGTDVSASDFAANLQSNGYKVVQQGISQNGPYTVLSDGTRTYTIYTATSTGQASVQVFDASGKPLMKYRLP